ncbi:MAG: PD-(D/E)XK nuclease family protein [Planctomycetes bacterium]|nr:PD-(D/E)XK nuclease family protein [Planctomycetota bacterium]
MSNILTISRIRSRQTCARKHHYEYVEGWRPVQDAEYFVVGRAFHAGLEAWWDVVGGGKLDPLEAALAQVRGLAIDPDPFRLVVVEEMLRAYDRRWRPSAGRYVLLANEQSFTAPLINPATQAASRTWLLGGVVDKIVRDTETGRVLIVEHKTTSEPIEDLAHPYWAKLGMDAQISQYFIGATALGHEVDGCLYDVAKKPAQRPGQVAVVDDGAKVVLGPDGQRVRTADGKKWRETGDSAKGYVLQTRPETPDEFRERVRAALEANIDRFLQRRDVARLETQLADHLHDVWSMGRQMADDERAGRAPRNPQACHAYGTCPFWLVCSTSSDPSDHAGVYVRVEDVHPELRVVQR